ncbi:hypothetical protein KVT40_004837 [Elsinoe batatas]|uniref:Uncharacterized protein n=1 Tax=Elsinoe batatas TaxID=2601811 RepID=A0A8K0L2P6_9PEZI|nr:hypothetical protein KVT40_004837 [Elsinoe batatas]
MIRVMILDDSHDPVTIPDETMDFSSGQSLKRKTSDAPISRVSKPRRSRKVRTLSSAAYTDFTRNFPQTGRSILGAIKQCAGDEYNAEIFAQLFCGIGSPSVLLDLRDVLQNLGTIVRPVYTEHLDCHQTLTALEQLDRLDSTSRILRRLFLHRLCVLRHERIRHHESEKWKQSLRSRGTRSSRAASLALHDLVLWSSQPGKQDADALAKRRTWMENKLRRGRNWCQLSNTFSPLVLMLVPQGREFTISDTDIEKINGSAWDQFTKILRCHRGHFLDRLLGVLPEDLVMVWMKESKNDMVPPAQMISAPPDSMELLEQYRIMCNPGYKCAGSSSFNKEAGVHDRQLDQS